MRILVTSAGSGVASAVCEAAQESTHEVIAATTTVAAADVSFAHVYEVPPTSQAGAFQHAVLEIVRRERPALVLAGRDDDILALAEIAADLSQLGATWTGSDMTFARSCRDKAWVAATLHELGFPAARCATTGADAVELARGSGYPLVVKPRRGDGSRGARLVHDESSMLDAFAAPLRPLIAQPYLRPLGEAIPCTLEQRDEFSAQAIVGHSDVSITCNRLRDGVPVEAVAVLPRELAALVTDLADQLAGLGCRGPVNVQAKQVAAGSFVIFEINFRCTGLTGARAKMGFNELDILAGAPAGAGWQAAVTRGLVAYRELSGYRVEEITCRSR
ncbi:MAG: hypothetical protein Q8O33_08155 [Pseudomonadota bacterium]|nr:hypothetical protein [Pseudomonadota bacterium]